MAPNVIDTLLGMFNGDECYQYHPELPLLLTFLFHSFLQLLYSTMNFSSLGTFSFAKKSIVLR